MKIKSFGAYLLSAAVSAFIFSSIPASAQIDVIQLARTQTQLHTYNSLKNQLSMTIDDLNNVLQVPDTAKLKSAVDMWLSKMDRLAADYYQSPNRKTASAYSSELKKIRFKFKDLTQKLATYMVKPLQVLEIMHEYESDTLVINWPEVDTMMKPTKDLIERFADVESRMEHICQQSEKIAQEKLAQGEFISNELYDEADVQAVEQYLHNR